MHSIIVMGNSIHFYSPPGHGLLIPRAVNQGLSRVWTHHYGRTGYYLISQFFHECYHFGWSCHKDLPHLFVMCGKLMFCCIAGMQLHLLLCLLISQLMKPHVNCLHSFWLDDVVVDALGCDVVGDNGCMGLGVAELHQHNPFINSLPCTYVGHS